MVVTIGYSNDILHGNHFSGESLNKPGTFWKVKNWAAGIEPAPRGKRGDHHKPPKTTKNNKKSNK
jgi:hypothetical protein